MNLLSSLWWKLGAALVALVSLANPVPASQPGQLGTAIPKVIAVFTTSLQSAISTSDTSMTLVSGTDKAGNAISGYTCFNIDEGSASEEFVCGTASSTAVTTMLRGVDPVNGSLSVTALKKSHRRGASVKITNYPVDGIMARILNGDDTIPNVLQYATSVTNAAIAANGYNLVDQNQLASTSFSGTVPANPSGIAGIAMFPTIGQLIAGTPTSSYLGTTYYLHPWNAYFNTTSSATTTVPVSGTNGKLSQGFLDLTQNFAVSGGWTFSSTTSISGTFAVTGSSTLASTTFTGIPFIPTTTPTLAQQVVSKYYNDATSPLYLNDNAFVDNGSGGVATSTFSLSQAGRVLVSLRGSMQNGTGGDGCAITLFVDGVMPSDWATTTITSAVGNNRQNIGTTYITASLSAASHTIVASSSIVTGGTCAQAGLARLTTEYIGQ